MWKDNSNWSITPCALLCCLGTVFPYNDMPMGQSSSMSSMASSSLGNGMASPSLGNGMASSSLGNGLASPSLGNGMDGLFGRTPQQSNSMMFEEKPAYLANQNPPMDDKMSSSLSDLGGIKLDDKMPSFNTKNMFSYGGSPKNYLSSLLDDGLMRGHGKPIGILGNILKASQSLPTGRVVKPSARVTKLVQWWSILSRRQKLERSKSIAKTGSQSSSEKHTINKLHKQVLNMNQKTTKKTG